MGILYYRVDKNGQDCIKLVPFLELTPQEVGDLLDKFSLTFEVNT